ncbi:MAG: hypothetical protein J6S14_03060 [Clostridia bacterium]|nr:hypothetical protein [Clostridia bacterium]
MNPLFNALGGAAMGKMNPMSMLAQLKQNPLGMLRQYGFNVPDSLTDPNAIIQHLMNSGQINQQQYNRARQMAQQFGLK